jgi:hypothetical protein
MPAARQGDMVAEAGPPNSIAMVSRRYYRISSETGDEMSKDFMGKGFKFPPKLDNKTESFNWPNMRKIKGSHYNNPFNIQGRKGDASRLWMRHTRLYF